MRFEMNFRFALFVIAFTLLSSGAYAYQTFNTNPFFSSSHNGYYIADSFINHTILANYYSCFNVSSDLGKMWLYPATDRCDLGLTNTWDFAAVTFKMLSDNGYYKMMDGDYIHMESIPGSEWCDQPETSPFGINPFGFNLTPPVCGGFNYIILPANDEGIVFLNYTLSRNDNINYGNTTLEVWENGVTQINASNIANSGTNTRVLYIPPANHNRNITVFASWKWADNSYVMPTNITINRFQFYTEDVIESRADWTNSASTEFARYCGSGSAIASGTGEGPHYAMYNSTSYIFGTDANGVNCGVVRLGQVCIARHWGYQNQGSGGTCNVNYFYWTPNFFFVKSYYNSNFTGFFEMFNQTYVRMTTMYAHTVSGHAGEDIIMYDDSYPTIINVSSFRDNYSTSFRQIIRLVQNPNVSINNNVPDGNTFHYATVCGAYYRESPYLPWFTSSISVGGGTWYCLNNSEYFITAEGLHINDANCGTCGCQGAGAGYRCIQESDHWECINNNTALRHYGTGCIVLTTSRCDFGCSDQQCTGQAFCTSDSGCATYCDSASGNVYYNAYCHNDSGICDWHSYKGCEFGCNDIYHDCNPRPLLTGVLLPVTSAFLGFDNTSTMLFLAVMLSLAAAAIVTYLVSFRGGFGAAGVVFGITFIAGVMFFSMINPPWINAIAMVLLLILAGILVAWQISRMGGG